MQDEGSDPARLAAPIAADRQLVPWPAPRRPDRHGLPVHGDTLFAASLLASASNAETVRSHGRAPLSEAIACYRSALARIA